MIVQYHADEDVADGGDLLALKQQAKADADDNGITLIAPGNRNDNWKVVYNQVKTALGTAWKTDYEALKGSVKLVWYQWGLMTLEEIIA